MTAQPDYIANIMQIDPRLIKVLSQTAEKSVDRMRMEELAGEFAENRGKITQLPRKEYYRDAVIVMSVNYNMIEEGFKKEVSNVVKFQPKNVFAQNNRDTGKPQNGPAIRLGQIVKFQPETASAQQPEQTGNVRYLKHYQKAG